MDCAGFGGLVRRRAERLARFQPGAGSDTPPVGEANGSHRSIVDTYSTHTAL
jgi:hypothetical protein